MYCIECGNEISDSDEFCTKCGTRVNGIAADSGTAGVPVATVIDQPSANVTAPLPADDAPTTLQPSANQTAPIQTVTHKTAVTGLGGKRNNSVIGAIIACIVIILAIIVCVAFVLGGSPSGKTQGQSSATASQQATSTAGGSSSAAPGSSSAPSSSAGTDQSASAFTHFNGVSASSVLPTDDLNPKSYAAENLLDSNPATVWAEAEDGPGIGSNVTFKGGTSQLFTGVEIWNGYQENDHLYQINARPKNMEVYADGEYIDSFILADSGRESQVIYFSEPFEARDVMLVIRDVYQGTKWPDCCISEVRFF